MMSQHNNYESNIIQSGPIRSPIVLSSGVMVSNQEQQSPARPLPPQLKSDLEMYFENYKLC